MSASDPPSGRPVRPSRRSRVLRVALEGAATLLVAAAVVGHWMNSASATGVLLRVAEDQVSVVVDAWSDEVEVDDAPGYRVLTPWMQDAYCISKTPIEYVLAGNQWVHHNHAPRLAVRSADGSNFWFEEVRIQYAARPERAADVVRDAGGDFAWHHGTMDAYARAVLRETFGAYTAEEIVLQEYLRDATVRAASRRRSSASTFATARDAECRLEPLSTHTKRYATRPRDARATPHRRTTRTSFVTAPRSRRVVTTSPRASSPARRRSTSPTVENYTPARSRSPCDTRAGCDSSAAPSTRTA